MRRLLSFAIAGMLALSSATLALGAETKKGAQTAEKKGAQAAQKKAPPATADRCAAMTQDGDQCKRKAEAGSKFCWQHNKSKGEKGKSEAKGKTGDPGAKKK